MWSHIVIISVGCVWLCKWVCDCISASVRVNIIVWACVWSCKYEGVTACEYVWECVCVHTHLSIRVCTCEWLHKTVKVCVCVGVQGVCKYMITQWKYVFGVITYISTSQHVSMCVWTHTGMYGCCVMVHMHPGFGNFRCAWCGSFSSPPAGCDTKQYLSLSSWFGLSSVLAKGQPWVLTMRKP